MQTYTLRSPPPIVGYWTLGPLEGQTGQTRFCTVKQPRWIVRFLARLLLDCVWTKV